MTGWGDWKQVDELFESGSLYASTIYSYDPLDDLTSVAQGQASPPVTQTRSFEYDLLKRLSRATNPENGQVQFTYYGNGNLQTKTDARSPAVVTSYLYDRMNRITRRSYSDSTPQVDYYYDGQSLPAGSRSFDRGLSTGRLVATLYGGSTSTTGSYQGYDAAGRVPISLQKTDAQAYQTTYGYDLAGNMTSETYPSGKEVRTAFDSAGRIGSLSRYISGVLDKTYATFSYCPCGAVVTATLGNGLTEQRNYNSRLQPSSIDLRKASDSTLIFGLDFGYGATGANNGNVMSQTIRIGGTNTPAATINQNYTYDHLNRLIQATETVNSVQQWQQTYDCDRWGNRAVRAGSYIPAANIGLTPPSASGTDFSAFDQSTNRLNSNMGQADLCFHSTWLVECPTAIHQVILRKADAFESANARKLISEGVSKYLGHSDLYTHNSQEGQYSVWADAVTFDWNGKLKVWMTDQSVDDVVRMVLHLPLNS